MMLKRTVFATALNPIVGDLELDETGDLSWVGTPAQGLQGFHLEVAQRIRSRLAFFRGEWYLDARVGVPYYQRILGIKGVSDATLTAIFGQVVRRTPGVSSVESISVARNPRTRQATLRFTARLQDGFILDSRTVALFIVRS